MANTQTKRHVRQIVKAVTACRGMVYKAAEMLGVTPVTIYKYAKRFPEVQEAISNARGGVLDTTELKLFDAIERGDAWAIAFALRTIGKHRGYGDAREIPEIVDDNTDAFATLDGRISSLAGARSMDEDTRELIN